MRGGAFFAAVLLGSGFVCAQVPALALAQSAASQSVQKPAQHPSHSPAAHKAAGHVVPAPEPEIPPPPPMPKWPVNDSPSRALVTWDSHGLRVEASNSSLQQILKEVSLETGAKLEGMIADQRIYGSYGPGQARDVISQLLQGSGYNVLLAGDLGSGAPRQIFLTPRNTGAGSAASANPLRQNNSSDDDSNDNSEVEEIPQPPPQQAVPMQPIPTQPNPNVGRPGFGTNGPIRTPQQVMEEMQRQQLLQQQQQPQDNSPQ
jgi:hypothetical protein